MHIPPAEGALQRRLLPISRRSEQQRTRPGIQHTQALLWMDGWPNPARFREELRRRREFRRVQKAHQNHTTLLGLIKACGRLKDLHKGSRIHAHVLRTGLLKKNIYVGTTLLRMYARCGALEKAQEVFDELPVRDAVSWTALITGYAQYGFGEEAMSCYRKMRNEGFSPDGVTSLCILKACGSAGAAEKGEGIHSELCRLGLLENHDIVLGTALLDMYAKCGALAKAQEVFDVLLVRNVVTWTALIAGYVQHGHSDKALNCFGLMQDEGVSPNAITFACVLKACGSLGATEKGEEIHAEVRRLGLLEGHDIVLGTALVDMYAKCGALAKAQEVFNGLLVRDAVSWSALIAGYAQHGLGEEALNCFEQMHDEGFSPDHMTFACMLKVCGSIGAREKGKEIHDEICRLGFLQKHDIVLGTALVDMYVKFGALAKAEEVLYELPVRNVLTWTALIAGYVQHGHGDEALSCFERMVKDGVSPNAVTFVCILKACGSIGATEKGKEIHTEVHRLGLLEDQNIVLGTALVDMYSKCGALTKAQEMFDELPIRNRVSFNSLITGYARFGKAKIVFDLFCKMREECIEPDGVTFIALLTACSHAGLVDEGQTYFDIMNTFYRIIPTLEHHTCMVDLFSRAGHFDKAVSMIEKVPDSNVWLALLGSCQKGVNVELGRWAFEHALHLDDKGAAVCLLYE